MSAGGVNYPAGDQFTWYDENGWEHGRGGRAEELIANGWTVDASGTWTGPKR